MPEPDETARVEADPSLDRYARIVRRALGVPVALVSLVEPTRQVFPGALGLPEPYQTMRETPLSHSFCQYVVLDRQPLVITDARTDPRLRTNLAIRDLNVIAYAGWPLTDETGTVIGSLCAIDSSPREWSAEDIAQLRDLAAACSAELVQRQRRLEARAAEGAARALSRRSRVLLLLSETLASTITLVDIAEAVHRVALEALGCSNAGLWLIDDAQLLQHVPHPDIAWATAQRHARFPLDHSSPLGAAALGGHGLFFPARDDRDGRYPSLARDDEPGYGEARALMPLLAGRDVLGTLALVWAVPREFSDEDRVTIAALSTYTAQAVQRAQLLAERATAATTLMRAMLTDLPVVPSLQLAARYRAAIVADEVGGDWYDAVVMPTGDTSLMIGDVTGHDIQAAASMGQLRSMLRALAWAVDDLPSANVRRLDRAMRELKVRCTATLVYARIEHSDDAEADDLHTLRWTNAGHPPPLLVAPDGSTRFLDDDVRADPLLGVMPAAERHDQTARIPAGSTLLLYTDGLIERRDAGIDDGLDQLVLVAGLHHKRPVEQMVDAIIDDLVGHAPADDVAVMAVRFASKEVIVP